MFLYQIGEEIGYYAIRIQIQYYYYHKLYNDQVILYSKVIKTDDPLVFDLYNSVRQTTCILIMAYHPYFHDSGLYITTSVFTTDITAFIAHPGLDIYKYYDDRWWLYVGLKADYNRDSSFITILYKK